MGNFWNDMSGLGKGFFIVGCVAAALLVIQIIFMVIGFAGGGDADVDTDFDGDADVDGGDGIGLFTVKGLIAFFAIGGWVGLGMDSAGLHPALSVIIACVCGAGAFIAVGFIYKAMFKLQSSGNIRIEGAVGKTAEVYLRIPASGTGKVTVLLQEREVEFDARTRCGYDIPTGSRVMVVETVGGKLVVEPIENADVINA